MLSHGHSGFKRIACCEPCVLEAADGPRQGFVWNVSVVGAYVVVRAVPKEGELVWISFSLPEDPVQIKARARVVWNNGPSLRSGCGQRAGALPPGCGIQFTGLEAADLARIDARVRSRYPASRGDPGRVT